MKRTCFLVLGRRSEGVLWVRASALDYQSALLNKLSGVETLFGPSQHFILTTSGQYRRQNSTAKPRQIERCIVFKERAPAS
jgi:hypothetical protein